MTRIVQVNKHDDLRVIKSDVGDWYYTKENIEIGNYNLIMENVNGRWWVTEATKVPPVDYKQLSKEFRQRVKEFKK